MKTHNLGYPRIGSHRELKWACEKYWAGKIGSQELITIAKQIRDQNWKLQAETGIDLIPSNDFSYYDQVLDMSLTLGVIPSRYHPLQNDPGVTDLDLYFAMARGYQKGNLDITAMEMTKWFDTNYHYIVPEFVKDQSFELLSTKILDEFIEAKEAGIITKPVLIGPVTFLLLGKEKESGFNKIELLDSLLPVYTQILKKLEIRGAEWIQFDEPILTTDLSREALDGVKKTYERFAEEFPGLKIQLSNYFDCYGENLDTVLNLPVQALHLDLIRCPSQLDDILSSGKLSDKILSLGVIDGRNIWRNDFEHSLKLINKAVEHIGKERIMLAPSCSLLHCPVDVESEFDGNKLQSEVKGWLAFAKQKIEELVLLKKITSDDPSNVISQAYLQHVEACRSRKSSPLVNNEKVKRRLSEIKDNDMRRVSSFSDRKKQQSRQLNLPDFPTTTIGSFPQTGRVRKARAQFKKGELTPEQYDNFLKEETLEAIRWQEDIGLDVLVHGEFERNDMVEYFGEQLDGFVFTSNGWVQSYGSRCVKPPIIFGDVSRPEPMTIEWSKFAQAATQKPVKGMLTGPVTILQWSFVRDDQPRSTTCNQIALAIRDEVIDLEKAGIKVIQVDEPAIREGLPLRKENWQDYLDWAVGAFRLATSGVQDATQIHTHMCYSEFNDIIDHIAAMDADVITIECSRSQMELLDAFAEFQYPNDIGPGVYDIHSPRVPSKKAMIDLLEKARSVIAYEQLWVNPDCGLKTRRWEETKEALKEMVDAARNMRKWVVEPTI